MGEEGQRDEAIPRAPLPHLVLVQPHFLLRRLEGDLDRPAPSRHPHKFLERGAVRSKDDVIGPVLRVLQATPHQ